MFGFGKSALEKALTQRAEMTLRPFGLEGEAPRIVEEAKAKTLSLTPNLDSLVFGDSLIKNEAYVHVRLQEGLTIEEIRQYWNKGVFLRTLDVTIRELLQFMQLNIAEQMGQDLNVVARQRSREGPNYGNPKDFNLSLPVNSGRSMQDSPIPIELSDKVNAWESKISPQAKEALLERFSTYNSMVRHLVANGQL